jgi:hypothetical protein
MASNTEQSPRPCRERGHTLHVIDLENLVGWPHRAPFIARAWFTYQDEIGIAARDRAVIVVGRGLAQAARAVIPLWLPLISCEPGPNTADRMLIRLADRELMSDRYDTVIIGSGDRAFVRTVRHAEARGARVELVTGVGTVSHRLAESCPCRTQLGIPVLK